MVIGRAEVLERIDAALGAARAGTSCALVLLGEPGIGKSAVLREATRRAEGWRVLTARGIEGEAHLAFAGLADLLRPLLARLDHLPPAQAVALRAALALGPPSVPDRFATYSAAVGLLSLGARASPVLVVVDDLHWLDAPSAEAVRFCARRLGDAPVCVLAAARPDEVREDAIAGLEPVPLPPLDEPDARACLLAHAPEPPSREAAERALTAAAGNPLALIELSHLLAAGRWDPDAAAAPAGELVTRAFSRRVRRLPERTRRALVMAALSDGRLGPLDVGLRARRLAIADLQPAEGSVVELDGSRLRFTHPLLRNVVAALAEPATRRDAHRALADALVAPADAAARAMHLAEASPGPDEDVARELEAAAQGALPRTGFAAAALLLERAAALTAESSPARAGRLLAGGTAAQLAGQDHRAISLLRRAMEDTADPVLRAQAAHALGVLHTWRGPLDEAYAILTEEGRRVEPSAPPLAALLHAAATVTRTLAARPDEALASARRALTLGAGAPAPLPLFTMAVLAWALVVRGHGRAAAGLITGAEAAVDALDPLSPEGQLIIILVLALIWTERYDAAERIGSRALRTAREAGAAGVAAHYLVLRCEAALHAGRLHEARADGLEALPLLGGAEHAVTAAFCLGRLAQAEAALGETAACRAHALTATARSDELGATSVRFLAQTALGALALGAGDHRTACAHLLPVEELARARAVRAPLAAQWQPDLVEALGRLGDLAGARRVLRGLAEDAGRTGGRWAAVVTARARGIVAEDGERHFREALELGRGLPSGYDQARTELCFGERLRRAGRRAEARQHLAAALEGLEVAGARLWAARARDELAGLGVRAPRPAADAHRLSPRELQAAREAARGATNAEVAARLFISEKTVERHLGAVYRKLGVRSRAELAWRFARDERRAGAPGE